MALPEASQNRAGDGLPLQITALPVLLDNYVFVLVRGGEAAVVDPAVAAPVRDWLEQRGLALVAVLQTHHHSDHIGGTPELLRRWPAAAVVASGADRQRIPFQTRSVAGGDRFGLLGRTLEVLAVPGHTRAHIAFHLPAQGEEGAELFCGDTLFAGGCGRLFEGTPEQMLHSLRELTGLDPTTRVWCAHEYTESNLRWAAAQRPEDAAIASRLAAVRLCRARGEATIPSSVALERATNLFVRAGDAAELAELRRSKNDWRG
ncbi:MAG: hydroxyacylglutathione hydrolase [Cyanobium sp.]